MTRARLINARPSLPGGEIQRDRRPHDAMPPVCPARPGCRVLARNIERRIGRPEHHVFAAFSRSMLVLDRIRSVEHFARIARTHASFHTRRSPAVAHAAHGRSIAPTSTLAGTPRRHRAARARSQRATPDTGSPASGCAPPPHRLARRSQDTGRAMWRIDPNCARRGPASRYPIRR